MRIAVALASCLLVAGCARSSLGPDLEPPDAHTLDAAAPVDASAGEDASAVEDAGPGEDASAGEDASSAVDANAAVDAGSAGVGGPCTTDAPCGAGLECYTLAPDGYCLPGSPGGPTACRPPDVTCPEGTLCSPLPYHQISGVCMRACETSADCRPGYQCAVVALFPGDPSSPTSDGRVCWISCEPGVDQSCNDDPTTSSLRGRCRADGTCECNAGSALNPETGRCR